MSPWAGTGDGGPGRASGDARSTRDGGRERDASALDEAETEHKGGTERVM